MGKQVNYTMDYPAFLQLAKYALELGCMIIRNDHTEEPSFPSKDISMVVPECSHYLFYCPALFPLDQITHSQDSAGKYYIADTFSSLFSLSIISAGFYRIYVTTGFFNNAGEWVPRPDKLTQIYDKIARKARKLATEVR